MTGTWIDSILRRAATFSVASDLVLEPLDDETLAVRVRLAGVYLQLDRCPADGSAAAIARLQALAGVPANMVDEPQDGRIDGRQFGLPGDLRASFLPPCVGRVRRCIADAERHCRMLAGWYRRAALPRLALTAFAVAALVLAAGGGVVLGAARMWTAAPL